MLQGVMACPVLPWCVLMQPWAFLNAILTDVPSNRCFRSHAHLVSRANRSHRRVPTAPPRDHNEYAPINRRFPSRLGPVLRAYCPCNGHGLLRSRLQCTLSRALPLIPSGNLVRLSLWASSAQRRARNLCAPARGRRRESPHRTTVRRAGGCGDTEVCLWRSCERG